MPKYLNNEEEKRKNIAKLVASRSNGKLGMYSAISPEHLAAYGKTNSMPAHAFSDRATGIAYRPQTSLLEPQASMLFDEPKTVGAAYKGPLIDRYPKLGQTPLAVKGLDGNTLGEFVGGYLPDDKRTGKVNISNGLANSAGDLLDEVTTHELSHAMNHYNRSRATTAAEANYEQPDPDKRTAYKNYRNTPEEYVAFKAGEMAKETDVGKIARHFNEQRELKWGAGDNETLKSTDGTTGYNSKYSQTDPTEGFTRRSLNTQRTDHQVLDYNNEVPLPEEPPNSSFARKFSKFGNKVNMAANVQSLFHTKKAYNAAKKAGASPLAAIMSQLGLAPITERLKDGGIYNHGTGETTYQKGLEPI